MKNVKDHFAKDSIAFDNDIEYCEAVSNLLGYFDVLIQIDQSLRIKVGE